MRRICCARAANGQETAAPAKECDEFASLHVIIHIVIAGLVTAISLRRHCALGVSAGQARA